MRLTACIGTPVRGAGGPSTACRPQPARCDLVSRAGSHPRRELRTAGL